MDSGVIHDLPMSKMTGVLSEAGTAYPSWEHEITPGFWDIRVAHLFSFLCCVFVFYLSSSCVLCAHCCQFLWIVHYWLPLWVVFSNVCLIKLGWTDCQCSFIKSSQCLVVLIGNTIRDYWSIASNVILVC